MTMRARHVRLGFLLMGSVGMSIAFLGAGAMPAAAEGDPSPTPVASGPVSPTPAETTTTTPPTASDPTAPNGSPAEGLPGSRTEGTDNQDGSSGKERTARRAGQSAVDVVDNRFRPSPLTVQVGTEVVWTSDGQNPHTVTADDGSFGSGNLDNGDTFSTTFDEPGSFAYYCEIHGGPGGSGMSGVVVVQAASGGRGDQDSGEGGLAQTGSEPIPILLVAVGLAIAGVLSLFMGRRGDHRARGI
jgi:plastocyanin